jgi:hypothetical protein
MTIDDARDALTAPTTFLDTLKAVTLVAAFIGFLATCAALVEWWDTTWRIAVSPIRAEVYSARIAPSPCLLHSWWWWRESGCRLI